MRKLMIATACAAMVIAGSNRSEAVPITLYESATAGPSFYGGYSVDFANTLGVRFFLPGPVTATGMGGFLGQAYFPQSQVGPYGDGGTLFGGLVQLTDANDLPDSNLLTTPDVIAHVLVTPAYNTGADVSANFVGGALSLASGWYFLGFTDHDGPDANGLYTAGFASAANPVVGSPQFFACCANPTFVQTQVIDGQGMRFFLLGERAADDTAPVPEPASMLLLGTGLATAAARKLRKHQ